MDQTSSFGGFVRQRRREMDLTQEELARRVGCAAITLRKIEADDLRASVQIAERLAMALAIPLEERAEFVRWARSVRPHSSNLPAVTPPPSMEEIGREDLTGRAIRGYALAERIGMGGMGSVYRAVQPNVDREVAVKIILPAVANHPDFIRRFEVEAQLVARLEHPHIVPLYDYWREPGVAYLVMRLLRGGNVQSLLSQGPLAVEMTTRMLEQICSALNTAHRIGVIHRDLKPANVLLDEDNNAYLADFGIAKNLGNPDLESQTQLDVMIGSPQYMSPEQIRSLSVRPQTDIYCLGVMLYEMLTGASPFTGPTPFDFIQQHINTPMPPLSANRAGLPFELDAVIARATAKDPDVRYADSLSLFNDFRQAAGRVIGAQTVINIEYEEEESDIKISNPFKGLRAFNEADAENFFGRETLVQQLLARLGEGGDLSRFLAVIGPSGSGKSSVVRAGLIPALRRGGLPSSENWFIVDMLPGKHPFEEFEASLLRVAVNPPQSLLSQLKDGPRGILRAVHRILPVDESVELVLVIDQFEEVFTLVEDESERALLLESLAAAVLDERSRLRVIVTLRADFTDKPLRYVDFGELLNRRFEFVLPLTADEVERAVAGPAQRAGLKLEKGLVSTIIRDTGNQPGALPLLQYALSELFEKRAGRTLTNQAYKEVGGVLGALGRRAEAVYADLDERSRSTARQLFLRLVTLGEGTEDTRRRVLGAELENLTIDDGRQTTPALASGASVVNGPLSTVISAFGNARLLTFDRDPLTRGATIEVAHEALLREWTRLREWLNECRSDVRIQRQLANAVNEWQSADCNPGFLMAGSRLEQFEGWAASTTVLLTQDERAFLDASIAERDRREAEERARQQRELEAAQKLAQTEHARAVEQTQSATRLRTRNRVITTVGSFALILALLAGMFGVQSNQNATVAQNNAATAQVAKDNAFNAQATTQAERDLADEAAKTSFSRELAAAAISSLDEDPERSILLALQAEKTTHTPEADNALHRSILASHTVLVVHNGAPVWDVNFSPDGKRFATASQDKTAKVWDVKTGQLLLTLTGHTDQVAGIVYSPDGQRIATSSEDHTAKIWDATTGQLLLTLTGPTNVGGPFAFSPDGTRLVTTSLVGIKVWDAVTGKGLLTFTEPFIQPGFYYSDVAFNADGHRIATAGNDGIVSIWDVTTGKESLTLSIDSEFGAEQPSMAFSPDGKRVALVSDRLKPVKIWDATTGEVLLSVDLGHASSANDIAFSPDGKLAITAGNDQKANVWDTTTGRILYTLSGHTQAIIGVAFSPDGTHVATASSDGTARIWDVTPAKELLFIPFAHPEINWNEWLSYNVDGTRIVTDYTDSNARIWDALSGKELMQLGGFNGNTGAVQPSYSPNGKLIAAGNGDSKIFVWDAQTGEQRTTLVGFQGWARHTAFSPDGTRLASANDNDGTKASKIVGTVTIWDLASAKALLTMQVSPHGTTSVAYSPNGKYLISGDWDANGIIWDANTGNKLFTLPEQSWVTAVSYSPDGKLVATGDFNGIVTLWNASTGKKLVTLKGHNGVVNAVAFSPDGKQVATAAKDGTARVWDVTTGENLLTLPVDAEGVGGVSFSPDGKRLAVGGYLGIYIFALPVENVVALAKSHLTRTLTTEECQQYLHLAACPTNP